MGGEMKELKKVHQLNVFLVETAFSSSTQVLQVEGRAPKLEIPIAGHGSAQLLIEKTPPVPPKWAAIDHL